MQMLLKILIVGLVWIPYRLSSLSKGSSFGQDFVVAAIAYGLAHVLLFALFGSQDAEPKEGSKPDDQLQGQQ